MRRGHVSFVLLALDAVVAALLRLRFLLERMHAFLAVSVGQTPGFEHGGPGSLGAGTGEDGAAKH